MAQSATSKPSENGKIYNISYFKLDYLNYI